MFRFNGDLFDESVEHLVQLVLFPQHACSSLTPLGQLTFCMLINVNSEFSEMLPTALASVCRLACSLLGAFACAYLNRDFTPVAVKSLPMRCGVSAAHLLLAPCPDKNNISHQGKVYMQSCSMEMFTFKCLSVHCVWGRAELPAKYVHPLSRDQSFGVLHHVPVLLALLRYSLIKALCFFSNVPHWKIKA